MMGDESAIRLAEILAPGLSVVFCGLNPALSAVRDGYNFSSPTNRFWRILHASGFTPRLLRADEESELLEYGCGITSAVSRATRGSTELTRQDYEKHAPALEMKVRGYGPANLAFLGKAAFAAISLKATVEWGHQTVKFGGADVWVLPNPSGLNRAFDFNRLVVHYQIMKASISPGPSDEE